MYVKWLIQDLLSAIMERISDGEPHDYLMNMENILLHEGVYPPYPPYYYNLTKLGDSRDQILRDTNEKKIINCSSETMLHEMWQFTKQVEPGFLIGYQ